MLLDVYERLETRKVAANTFNNSRTKPVRNEHLAVGLGEINNTLS